jgi:hypothetical protein
MTRPAVCGLLLLTVATPAAAQTRQGFVEGGVLADYDPTLRADKDTTAGVTGSAGFFITPRWSLRLELDRPQWHGRHWAGESRVVDRIEASDLQEDGRSPSWSLLAGRHYAQESRVSFSWVAGLTMVRREFRKSGWTERRDLQGNVTSHTDIDRRYPANTWPAVTAGADVTIALTKQLALVPQIRVHTYGGLSEHTSDLFVRPRVAVRWQF